MGENNEFLEEIMNNQVSKDLQKLLRVQIENGKDFIEMGKRHLERLGKLDEEIVSSTVREMLRKEMNEIANEMMEYEKMQENSEKLLEKGDEE